MKQFLWLFVALMIPTSLVFGQENSESVLLVSDKAEMKFCFDPNSRGNSKEILQDFEELFVLGLVDRENCMIKDNQNQEYDELVKRFIKKNLEKKINIYALPSLAGRQLKLLYTNSEDENFVNSTLTTRDKWEVAGLTLASMTLGSLVSERVYKGQPDKRKHLVLGATVSGVTTGATYYFLENTEFGKRLNLSAKARKNTILFSGPIVGTVVGILKEVYDSKHRSKRTKDPHDAAATSLGAGIGVFAINIPFY